MTPRRLQISLAALVILLGAGADSRADAPDACELDPSCKAHDATGLALVQAKRYGEALVEFETAYQSRPIPRLLINIGRCLFRVGRYQDAINAYDRFSAADPNADAQTQERVARYLEEAQQALRAAASPPASPGPAGDSFGVGVSVRSDATKAAPPVTETTSTRKPTSAAGRIPWGAGLLFGGGLGVLAAGAGFGVLAMQTGQVLVATPGPFNQAQFELGTRMNTAAIACDVAGGVMATVGVIWGGVAYAGKRNTTLSRNAVSTPSVISMAFTGSH